MSTMTTRQSLRLACVATYPPRQCGIGTFTQDLADAACNQLGGHRPQIGPAGCEIVALNDRPGGYDYDRRVAFEIEQEDPAHYRSAAEFLNIRGFDVLVVQHEYGIFGGRDGEFLLSLLRRVRMPVITVMHTVLPDPAEHLREVTAQLIRYSDRVVVMAETALQILKELYEVGCEKVCVIPHGVPDLAFVDPDFYKDKFHVGGRKVMLTFGLVSPGKGLEYATQAMPTLVARHPDLVFLILGATHPKVKEREGEAYRHKLIRLAEELGVLDHVIFHDRYVSLEELCEYLGSADIYITPYLGEQQIVSGTLSYAMAAGKAIVSTPYLYAREMLADERGRLVPFRDPGAIAEVVGELLADDEQRLKIRRNAYKFSRKMIWPEVARSYLRLCDELVSQPSVSRREVLAAANGAAALQKDLPELKLDHLLTLTDGTGILQHARFTVPHRDHGYCTDDNSRALIVALEAYRISPEPELLRLASRYLGFLTHAFNRETGRLRNFLSYDRRWLEEAGSEDAHARTVWGLGQAVRRAPLESMRSGIVEVFQQVVPAVVEFEHPRAWAFSIVGLHAYLDWSRGDSAARRMLEDLASRLAARYAEFADETWLFPDELVSYANGKLPHAMLLAGELLGDDGLLQTGLKSLKWLLELQTAADGVLSPVGNAGWLVRGGEKARFDQQPIEAHALVEACLEAGRLTGDRQWDLEARRSFDWFLGRNELGEPVYDFQTGGCRDGLHPDRVNRNEGAESTLAWLLSLMAIRSVQPVTEPAREPAPQEQPAPATALQG